MKTPQTLAPKARIAIACALIGLSVAGCDQLAVVGKSVAAVSEKGDDHGPETAPAEPEKGPNGGKLLRDGHFALEITIFEDGVEPEYRVYAYEHEKPVDPSQVKVGIDLGRLGGKVDRIGFKPQDGILRGDQVIVEPHSFDVTVSAEFKGKASTWSYESYEGRTRIAAASAEAAGVRVEKVSETQIAETIDLPGRLSFAPEARAEIRAWYPGRVTEMTRTVGQTVKAGEILARIEASETLRTYDIKAPISGVVMERNANVGDVAGAALYVLNDPRKLQAIFFAYPKDANRIAAGQQVEMVGLDGEKHVATVKTILPSADPSNQRVTILADVDNSDGAWRAGMAVEGRVTVASKKAGMAVKTRALQRFRDFTVVFTQVGETYEVRMLELGRRTPEWTEVLSGIEPGAPYVADNAFLIRADVEKSGASHDH